MSGHGEQRNANAVDGIGSGQKTATGHAESGLGETGLPESESARAGSGSDPKIATAHGATACGRTATKKTTAFDALARLAANGKRSESENDGHGHESGLYDPSLFLDPKIRKHGRIKKRSGPPKLLSTHHVAERAVMSGEKQPRKQRGQGKSAATEQPPPPLQLPKELKRQRRARVQQTNIQKHSPPPPLARPRSSGRRGSLTGHNTRCTLRFPPPPPPLLTCPPEGREEEEEEVPGCRTSEEVPARGEAPGAEGT